MPALRARSVKTPCAMSPAAADDSTWRNAAEYTRSVCRLTISRKAASSARPAKARGSSTSDFFCIPPIKHPNTGKSDKVFYARGELGEWERNFAKARPANKHG